jgi:hypothetical protein
MSAGDVELAKCKCELCSGHLEFERLHAGTIVPCPHCGIDTLLYVSQPATQELQPSLAPPGPRTKRCPFCAELILEDAIKCKHCGEFLDAAGVRVTPELPRPRGAGIAPYWKRLCYLILGTVLGFFLLLAILTNVNFNLSPEGGVEILGAVAVLIYFLPAFVGRNKKNANAIFVVNLFLGWTLIGWVVALAWAASSDQ